MSCKYNNCKHCGYKPECEIYKENTELKEALKGKRCNCMTYLNFKDLEKENAELKADFLKSCKVKEQGFREAEQALERKDEQLTKAKEIIKKLIEAIHIWDCKNLEQVEAEAEQFLKEGEVEK